MGIRNDWSLLHVNEYVEEVQDMKNKLEAGNKKMVISTTLQR